jgi:trehalose 6-phosphate phosphatase
MRLQSKNIEICHKTTLCRCLSRYDFSPVDIPQVNANWAVFLDFDGTLVDLAAQPDRAQLVPSVRYAVLSLFHNLGEAVAVVTGRHLADIDRHIGLPDLPLAGSHGLEIRSLRKNSPSIAHLSPVVAAATAAVNAFAATHPSLLVEQKPGGVVLNYHACPDMGNAVERAMTSIADQHSSMELLPGKMILELRPRGVTKGTAVDTYMAEAPFWGRTPVFIGDDRTDEDGFSAVQAIGGFGIKIGPGETAARYRLETACDARKLIQAWTDSLSDTKKQAFA